MGTIETGSPYLTYRQASAYCNVDRATLWRAVRDGRLNKSGPGGAPRFHVRDLDAFMSGRPVASSRSGEAT